MVAVDLHVAVVRNVLQVVEVARDDQVEEYLLMVRKDLAEVVGESLAGVVRFDPELLSESLKVGVGLNLKEIVGRSQMEAVWENRIVVWKKDLVKDVLHNPEFHLYHLYCHV